MIDIVEIFREIDFKYRAIGVNVETLLVGEYLWENTEYAYERDIRPDLMLGDRIPTQSQLPQRYPVYFQNIFIYCDKRMKYNQIKILFREAYTPQIVEIEGDNIVFHDLLILRYERDKQLKRPSVLQRKDIDLMSNATLKTMRKMNKDAKKRKYPLRDRLPRKEVN